MSNILNTKAAAYGAVVLVGGLILYFVAKKIAGAAGDAAAAVGQAVDPTSDKNLAYRGVNAVGGALTGDDSFSLGGWFYDLTHDEYDPNAKPTAATPGFAPRSVQVRAEASFFDRLIG